MMVRPFYWFGLLAIASTLGCRHGVNPNAPTVPMNLMVPQTRVPPPATGSYSSPGGYYQGQAAAPTTNTSTVLASNMPIDDVVGSGVQGVVTSPTPLSTWATASVPGYGVSGEPLVSGATLRQVSGTEPSPNDSLASQKDSQDYVSGTSGLRPQLRGMQVMDLSRPTQDTNKPAQMPQEPYPTTSPRVVDRSNDDLAPATRSDSSLLPWRNPLE